MMDPVRVLRVYHGGRIPAHRARERALVAAGIDVTLVAPADWPEGDAETGADSFATLELPVNRPGDVNPHRYTSHTAIQRVFREVRPDVLDLHEEPFSVAARQWLRAAPSDLPVVMYTAQNVDKRFPPPFAQYERAAYRRVAALYPCSAQAASVARGKGFAGAIEVLPLGYDDTAFVPGTQSLDADELVLGLFGRLVPEKGLTDAVRILARLNEARPTRLAPSLPTSSETVLVRLLLNPEGEIGADDVGVREGWRRRPWGGASRRRAERSGWRRSRAGAGRGSGAGRAAAAAAVHGRVQAAGVA
jgi:glycosyltransferase involved in cell wall biosynthesis